MTLYSSQWFLVRVVGSRTRYVLQIPEADCPIPGWSVYSVLAEGPDSQRPVRLKLYQRCDGEPEVPDGPHAA